MGEPVSEKSGSAAAVVPGGDGVLPAQVGQLARELELGELLEACAVPIYYLFARHGDVRVFQFEHGLVKQPRKAPLRALRWDQVATVRQRYQPEYTRAGSYLRTGFHYIFTREDGVTVSFTGTFRDTGRGSQWSRNDALTSPVQIASRTYARLAAEAARQVTQAQLPAAQAALEAGEEVTFGKVTVAAAGIRVHRRPLVPWAEVDMTMRDDVVMIKWARRSWPLYSRLSIEFPNLSLFLALADQLRKPDVS